MAMPRRFACIDIGTNTAILLVAEAPAHASDPVRVLAESAQVTRLGRGIGKSAATSDSRSALVQDNIDATLAALREFAAIARSFDAPIVAVGTEALRRASNAADFLTPAAGILDTQVTIIDGDREAALTFLAAAQSFPEAVHIGALVVDIGGGSTEIITARAGRVLYRSSLPLGSVRLTERFISADPPRAAELTALRAEVSDLLRGVPFGPGAPGAPAPALIGTAGTVTSFAAMALGLHDYDAARVHGFRLSRAALTEQLARLAHADQKQREAIAGLDPRRADVITAGGHLLDVIAAHAGASEILVSDRGIRWGLFFECLGFVTATLPPVATVGEAPG